MAKQRFGINDAYHGTVGTVIGYEWRGKWCLRARPLRVRNPRTEKQQSNRMVFKQAVALAGTMKLALRKGLHNVSMGLHITECNLFVKRNKGCFSLGEDGNLEVAWESLMLSEGSLAVPVFLKPVSNIADSGSKSSSPKLGEGDRREAVVEECVRNGSGIPNLSRSVSDFSTHSSVSRQAAASSPNLGEQPVCSIADSGSDSLSKFAPLRSQAMSPAEPGREGVDAKRTGACVFYPVSYSAGSDGGSWSSSPKLGEGDRREAVVEECVRNGRYITFPFSPCGEGEKACGDDEVYVYAYCPEAVEGVLSAPAWRRGGSVRLTLPERWQGKEVHFYGFAVDLDGEASETIYIGKLESSNTRPRQPQAAASDSGSKSSSPKLGEGDRRAAVVEECVRNGRWIQSVSDFPTHSSVSRQAAASSPNLGEQPVSNGADRDSGSSGSSPLPGSKGDTACDRSGANLGDSYPALQERTYTASDTNSHSAVENNFWRQSCSWNLSCIFAT